MFKENILLYYTNLETAEKIIRTKRIRMSLLRDSKDTFEAELPAYHYAACHIDDSANGASVYDADDLQIVCFSKGSYPIYSDRYDQSEKDETKYSLTVPAMFNVYSDFGEGICFFIEKDTFEIDNKLENRDIEYVENHHAVLKIMHETYLNSKCPCTYYDVFKYKHKSFCYENELRYFKKSTQEEFVNISNSLLGACRGPRLSNSGCKKLKDISTLVALDSLFTKRVIDEEISLFSVEESGNKLWELFPRIEENGRFPYRLLQMFRDKLRDNTWLINLPDGMTHIKIVDGKIASFHNNQTGKDEPWTNKKNNNEEGNS
jgi:hypothetical protein